MGHGGVRMPWPWKQGGTPRWIETVPAVSSRRGGDLNAYEGVAMLLGGRARLNCPLAWPDADWRVGPSRPLVWSREGGGDGSGTPAIGRHADGGSRGRRCRRPGTGGTVGPAM
ncbi:hypothetical protein NL676_000038 [Syzygium grande]|nr:hypothetical protein NL676_000038 [Syzygium grande]